MIGVILPKY